MHHSLAQLLCRRPHPHGPHAPPHLLSTHYSLPSRGLGRAAFTLLELLVVLSIIVIVIAMAIPVWSSLSGNNSVATAQNLVAAMLGNARNDALYNKQTIGVFFFIDPVTGQSAMAEVQLDGPPGFTYTPFSASPNGSANPGNAPKNGLVYPLEMVNYLPSTAANGKTAGVQQYIFYRDVVLLPSGVGVALYNNSNPYGATPAPGLDKYLRFGAIMFDANGNLTSIPYAVPMGRQTNYALNVDNAQPTATDQLALRLGLISLTINNQTVNQEFGDLCSQFTVSGSTNVYPLVSQVGLLFFDHNAYLSQVLPGGTSANEFTDFDIQCDPPLPNWQTLWPPSSGQKATEENWLAQNGVSFLVSPFDGSLIKAK